MSSQPQTRRGRSQDSTLPLAFVFSSLPLFLTPQGVAAGQGVTLLKQSLGGDPTGGGVGRSQPHHSLQCVGHFVVKTDDNSHQHEHGQQDPATDAVHDYGADSGRLIFIWAEKCRQSVNLAPSPYSHLATSGCFLQWSKNEPKPQVLRHGKTQISLPRRSQGLKLARRGENVFISE